jgi:glycerophosphoryl diester phosphodiesterase
MRRTEVTDNLSGDAMTRNPKLELTWRQLIQVVVRAWKPLVIYELLISWIAASVLGPLTVALSYRLIEMSGETALGNLELARFLLSPIGALAFVLTLSITLGLLLIEYSGLIVLADAAFRGTTLSIGQIFAGVFGAAPRLFSLAVFQTSIAIVVALPFLGLAAVTYWLLLTDADINYYLDARPPRFWIAVAIGIVLGIGCTISMVWFFLRWALAVPACVLDGQTSLAAQRSSAILMRGRARRLLFIFGGWQLLKYIAFIAAIAGLDQVNEVLFAGFADRLSLLIWSTVALLLVDAVVLQLVGAVFAIGTALLIAREYELALRSQPESWTAIQSSPLTSSVSTRPAWQARAAVVAIAILGPVLSVFYATRLAHEFVEHRPARVTGHRAGSKAAPENSVTALRLSIEAGADYVEIDAQLTADGHVVLLHDRDLRRVTGDARDLHDVNLADLKDLRLRDGDTTSEEGIPTLAEFIAACDGRIRLNVELKDFGHSPGLALAVLDVLREHDFTERAVVSSFQLPPLREIKLSEPGLPIGIILSAIQGDVTRLPVDFLSLNQWLVRADLVRRAHQSGMEVHVWTVNERETALRLLDLGCDNLITSDPVLIREVVDWYASLGDTEQMLLRIRRWIRE